MLPLPTLHSLLQLPSSALLCGSWKPASSQREGCVAEHGGHRGPGPGCMVRWTSESDSPSARRAWARCAEGHRPRRVWASWAPGQAQSGGISCLYTGLVRSGVCTVLPGAPSGEGVTASGEEHALGAHSRQQPLSLAPCSRGSPEQASFPSLQRSSWLSCCPHLCPCSTLFKINFKF